MKKQRYIVEIEMPDRDFISAGWLKDLIQTDCDVEDEDRKKVTVQEISFPSNLDEAAEEIVKDWLAYGDRDPKKTDSSETELMREAWKYWKEQGGGSHAQWDKFVKAVRHFAKWQKKQDEFVIDMKYGEGYIEGQDKMMERMVKEAVDGIVCINSKGFGYVRSVVLPDKLMKELDDKVKLIVLKDDEAIRRD